MAEWLGMKVILDVNVPTTSGLKSAARAAGRGTVVRGGPEARGQGAEKTWLPPGRGPQARNVFGPVSPKRASIGPVGHRANGVLALWPTGLIER